MSIITRGYKKAIFAALELCEGRENSFVKEYKGGSLILDSIAIIESAAQRKFWVGRPYEANAAQYYMDGGQ